MLMVNRKPASAFFGSILVVVIFLPSLVLSAAAESISDTVTDKQNDIKTAEEPLTVGIQKAILMAMENNRSLMVERMTPDIIRTFEQSERSIFDPVLGAEISPRRTVADRLSRAGSSTESQIVDTVTGSLSVDKFFSTGTNLELLARTSYTDSSLYSDTFTSNRLGITVTQALLQ